MALYQVVEKDDYGTDWSLVRYDDAANKRFDTEESALDAARRYVTSLNVENALAAGEKQRSAEAYMMTDDGAFLGVLDGENWYMYYQKDLVKNGSRVHSKGEPVTDLKYYELEGKTQVAVRVVPGT